MDGSTMDGSASERKVAQTKVVQTVVQTLEQSIAADRITVWDALEPTLQAQLGQAIEPDSGIDCVVYPQTVAELAQVLTCAHLNQWRVLPCGQGTKLHWGGLASGVQLAVSTARLNRLIDHAAGDLTVTAEAGLQLGELQTILAKAGQFLPLDPAYPATATLGGIVATADTGAWRQRYGGVRDLLIGLSFVRADGQPAKAGGRVVKNVAGYDLMKLLTGSYGTLGVISQVTLRVYPLPPASRTVVLTGPSDRIAQATRTLLASSLTPTAIELVVTPALSTNPLDLSLISRFQNIEVSVTTQAEQLLQVGRALELNGAILDDRAEADLWQQLRGQMDDRPTDHSQGGVITCKIGVLPSKAVETLTQFKPWESAIDLSLIHAGSGLGLLRGRSLTVQTLLEWRKICQAQGGFLSVLGAPVALKQQMNQQKLDIWGYSGNAIELMRQIKQQFDPDNRLSPDRFVGGI